MDDKRCEFIKLEIQLLFGWFSFFIMGTSGVMVYAYKSLNETIIKIISFFVLIQTIIGIVAVHKIYKDVLISNGSIPNGLKYAILSVLLTLYSYLIVLIILFLYSKYFVLFKLNTDKIPILCLNRIIY